MGEPTQISTKIGLPNGLADGGAIQRTVVAHEDLLVPIMVLFSSVPAPSLPIFQ